MGKLLVKQTIFPKVWKLVRINFFYSPDATPPQVLTVSTESGLKQ
ncbi:DUF3370 family protein [cyanobacterium endosymbiont of Epithemia turgida]